MKASMLGTSILPATFAEAALRHGRHFARYLYAAPYAVDKRVLDAACGGGFGSAFMARSAGSVLGVDLDEKMLACARKHFCAANLRFDAHDLHQPIPGGPFDLITSFETLEHVQDPHRCLTNLAASLDDDGTAIISVPNGQKELRQGNSKEYHQQHFSATDFRSLLEDRFEQVECFSQVYHKGFRHYLRKLIGRGGHRAGDYRFVDGLLEGAKTWLAVCRRVR